MVWFSMVSYGFLLSSTHIYTLHPTLGRHAYALISGPHSQSRVNLVSTLCAILLFRCVGLLYCLRFSVVSVLWFWPPNEARRSSRLKGCSSVPIRGTALTIKSDACFLWDELDTYNLLYGCVNSDHSDSIAYATITKQTPSYCHFIRPFPPIIPNPQVHMSTIVGVYLSSSVSPA